MKDLKTIQYVMGLIEEEQETLVETCESELLDLIPDEDERTDVLRYGIGEWLANADVYNFDDYYKGMYVGLSYLWNYLNQDEQELMKK